VKIRDHLNSIDVFAQLSDDDVQQVVTLVRETRVGAGAVVARQGEAGDALYVVSSGVLQTKASDGTGGGRPVAGCFEGQWLGGMAPVVPSSPPEPAVRASSAPLPEVAWIPRPAGKVFTVFSPKGGVGKSTVAVNLAVAMAKAHPQSVALLDLSLTFGHDMLMLNLVPRSSLAATSADALRTLGLDEDLSHYLAVHPSSGLRVMAGALHPEEGEAVSGDSAKAAIEMLRLHFPYVVVDTGSNFTDPVLCALEASDRVLMLCSPEISVLRDIRECQRILGEVIHLPGDRVLYLLNSVFPFKTISREQFESALHQELFAELPYGGDVPAKAALRGEAFVETQSASSLARALHRLASQLTDDNGRPSDLHQQYKRRGFFR